MRAQLEDRRNISSKTNVAPITWLRSSDPIRAVGASYSSVSPHVHRSIILLIDYRRSRPLRGNAASHRLLRKYDEWRKGIKCCVVVTACVLESTYSLQGRLMVDGRSMVFFIRTYLSTRHSLFFFCPSSTLPFPSASR